MPYILNILYFAILLLISPMVIYRIIKHNRYRKGWGQRLGFVPTRNSNKKCIWVHAVSMGEVNAASTIIDGIISETPDCDIIVSTTTDTGISRARKLYKDKATVIFYPFDFSFAVKRALNRLKPDLCVLMELEAWPNFTNITYKRKIPIIVANGRISSGKGFPRYKKIAWLIRPMFNKIAAVLVQDEEYADRFEYLGVAKDKIINAGSIKYDTAEITDNVAGANDLAKQLKLSPDTRLIVAGSTGAGEEQGIINCFKAIKDKLPEEKLRLAIIPRKPEKFDEVAGLITASGMELLRYSQIKTNEYTATEADSDSVILGDTMGDLRKFYSLAEIIFVGRSLVPMGGSDMMEAAALAKPVIVGPYTENFTQTVNALKESNGIIIAKDSKELESKISELLTDHNLANEISANGRKVIIDNQGATEKTIDCIKSFI